MYYQFDIMQSSNCAQSKMFGPISRRVHSIEIGKFSCALLPHRRNSCSSNLLPFTLMVLEYLLGPMAAWTLNIALNRTAWEYVVFPAGEANRINWNTRRPTGTGNVYSASADFVAGGEGGHSPLLKNPTPNGRYLQFLWSHCLRLRPFNHKILDPTLFLYNYCYS